MNVIAQGKRIDQVVQAKRPITERQTLGHIPSDVFTSSPESPPLESLKHDRPVVYDQPLLREGLPVYADFEQHFSARSASPLAWGLIGGFCGGVTGWILGGFAAMATGNAAFLLGGAATGLSVTAGLAALSARGDRVRLIGEEVPLESRQMTGVQVHSQPGTLQGEKGYFHRFSPALDRTPLGSYTQYKVEHFREDNPS
jgi:hypothetical protein